MVKIKFFISTGGGGDTGLFCGVMPETKNFELTKEQETAYLQKPSGCPACDSVDVLNLR